MWCSPNLSGLQIGPDDYKKICALLAKDSRRYGNIFMVLIYMGICVECWRVNAGVVSIYDMHQ